MIHTLPALAPDMFRLVATRTSLSYDWDYAQFNVKSNQFICANSSASCDRRMPRPPHLPPSHASIISQVPLGLSLPTSFVNCTHLTRPLLSLRPCLVICCENYICTISNTVRTICAPLLQLLHFTNCWQRPLSPSPSPLGTTPFLFAQRVCNLCEYKKKTVKFPGN